MLSYTLRLIHTSLWLYGFMYIVFVFFTNIISIM